jgi:hypothetical protein
VTYLLEEGTALEITHQGKIVQLEQDKPVKCRIVSKATTKRRAGKSKKTK